MSSEVRGEAVIVRRLQLALVLTRVTGPLAREVTAAQTDQQIAVATYNVENLDPSDTTRSS
jgi:hypothetical protein